METWDLVKLYGRAMRSSHYIEAISLGYQMLEYVFEVLLTQTNVGDEGKPLSKSKVNKADYLLSKASLAKEHGFIDQEIFNDVKAFNKIRRDVIHNMVNKGIDYGKVKECAEMIGPIYYKIQSQFFTWKVGIPENTK